MNVLAQIFFVACALASITGAFFTIASRNPIRSAMALLLTIGGITGLFLTLDAQFLAAIQLIVYAGAVVILFVFVIMLIGPDASPPDDSRAFLSRAFAAALFGLVALVTAVFLFRSSGGLHVFPSGRPELGSIEAFGRELYGRELVPFELASALFIVAIVGAVAVARGRHAKSDGPAEPQAPLGPSSPEARH